MTPDDTAAAAAPAPAAAAEPAPAAPQGAAETTPAAAPVEMQAAHDAVHGALEAATALDQQSPGNPAVRRVVDALDGALGILRGLLG